MPGISYGGGYADYMVVPIEAIVSIPDELSLLYSKQIRSIGSTCGNRKEFTELIDMSKELKTRVWKEFTLYEAKEAL